MNHAAGLKTGAPRATLKSGAPRRKRNSNIPRMTHLSVAILTVSDRCAQGEREDASGPGLVALCREKLGATFVEYALVSDGIEPVQAGIRRFAGKVDLILTTGGTGLAPRDFTPEATAPLLERRHPALLELARRRCYDITPKTYLSRGEAGVIGKTLVINLPGSPKGSREMLEALLDILPHAIETLRGEVKDG